MAISTTPTVARAVAVERLKNSTEKAVMNDIMLHIIPALRGQFIETFRHEIISLNVLRKGIYNGEGLQAVASSSLPIRPPRIQTLILGRIPDGQMLCSVVDCIAGFVAIVSVGEG